MKFLEKLKENFYEIVLFIGKGIAVIVAACFGIGFFWEPAWYVPGVYFSLILLIFFIFIIFQCILYPIEGIEKLIGNKTRDNKRKFLTTIISTMILITIILGGFILNNIYKNTYSELTRTVPDDTTPYNYILTLSYIDIEDNSVGQDFDLEAVIDYQGMPLSQDSQIIIGGAFSTSFIRFQLQAIENDSIPDVGWTDEEFTVQKLMQDEQFYLNVFVEENRGRFAGNVSTVSFYFDIKREVESSEVWSSILN